MDPRTLSRLRWGVLALTFGATTLNYVDRQVIALLKPTLEREFAWRDADYAHIVSGFQLATAVTFLFAGWFVDRVGLRRTPSRRRWGTSSACAWRGGSPRPSTRPPR